MCLFVFPMQYFSIFVVFWIECTVCICPNKIRAILLNLNSTEFSFVVFWGLVIMTHTHTHKNTNSRSFPLTHGCFQVNVIDSCLIHMKGLSGYKYSHWKRGREGGGEPCLAFLPYSLRSGVCNIYSVLKLVSSAQHPPTKHRVKGRYIERWLTLAFSCKWN